MSRRIRNMCVALEAYEELEPSMPIEEAEVGIATSDAEISEIQANIDAHEDAMNTLVEDQKTIDNLEAQVNQTVQSGEGTTEENAELVQVVVESIFRRHGLGRRNYPRVNLSNESFKTKADRVKVARKLAKNLRVSKEGIGQAIADVITKICEFIRDLFKKLMGKSNYSSGGSSNAKNALDEVSKESPEGDKTPMVFYKTQLIRMIRAIGHILKGFVMDDAEGKELINSIKEIQSDYSKAPALLNKITSDISKASAAVISGIDDSINAIKTAAKDVSGLKTLDIPRLSDQEYNNAVTKINNGNEAVKKTIAPCSELNQKRKEMTPILQETIDDVVSNIEENAEDTLSFDNFTLADLRKCFTDAARSKTETIKVDKKIEELLKTAESIEAGFNDVLNNWKAKRNAINSQQASQEETQNDTSQKLDELITVCSDNKTNIGAAVKDVSSNAATTVNSITTLQETVNEITTSSSNKTKEVIGHAKKVPNSPTPGMTITKWAYRFLDPELKKFFDKSPDGNYVCNKTE